MLLYFLIFSVFLIQFISYTSEVKQFLLIEIERMKVMQFC